MAQLVVSVAARTDVRQIIDDLEQRAGRQIALKYALDFDAAIDRISEMPGIGSPRPAFGQGVRIVVIDPYVMFYDVDASEDVLVLRILHGHRNITLEMIKDR